MEMYINKHAQWATQLLPHTLSPQQQQQQQQQRAEMLELHADVATQGQSAGGGPDGPVSKLPGLLDYVTTVENATEPASNSPTGFNCRVKLTVKPLAAAAAAATAAASSPGSSSAGSWFRVVGCGSEDEGLAVLENLSVSIDSEAGFRAAEAHVEVQEGQLVVVADSGESTLLTQWLVSALSSCMVCSRVLYLSVGFCPLLTCLHVDMHIFVEVVRHVLPASHCYTP
jgi:hypothetical protein